MDQTPRVQRRRRTHDEIAQLVAAYSTSGVSRAAFCRTHQLSLATLARYLERAPPATVHPVTRSSFVAVEIAPPTRTADSGLSLVWCSGRRLAIQRGFCVDTLRQLLSVLERR